MWMLSTIGGDGPTGKLASSHTKLTQFLYQPILNDECFRRFKMPELVSKTGGSFNLVM